MTLADSLRRYALRCVVKRAAQMICDTARSRGGRCHVVKSVTTETVYVHVKLDGKVRRYRVSTHRQARHRERVRTVDVVVRPGAGDEEIGVAIRGVVGIMKAGGR